MKAKKSLPALIGIYQRTHGPRLEEYLASFKKHGSLEDAMNVVYLEADGATMHRHQRRIGREVFQQVPHPFLEIVAHSWRKGLSAVYPRLQTVLAEVAAEPRQWLWYFDRVAKRSSAVLGQFGRVLDELEMYLGRRVPEPEDAVWLAHRVAEEIDPADYTRYRGHLLDVCLRECLDPERVAQAEERTSLEYGQRIRNDWPLRYVYRACTLFWS